MSAKKTSATFVTIENRTRRMKTYNLTSEQLRDHPEHGYERIEQFKTVHDPKTGNLSIQKARTTIPQSITFAAGEIKTNLLHVVTFPDEIKQAVARKDLKVTYQEGFIEEEEPGAPKPAPAMKAKDVARDLGAEAKEDSKLPPTKDVAARAEVKKTSSELSSK